MKAIETKPIQLRLGEMARTRGIIEQYKLIKVPAKRGGGFLEVKLFENAEVVELKGHKIVNLPAFELTHDVTVGKYIRGDWRYWTIFEKSMILARSKQVKK